MENWNKEYFITYIFFGVAYADEKMDDSELALIKDQVLDIVGCSELSTTIINDVKEKIITHTEAQKEKYITENMSKFITTDESRHRLIHGIEEIIIADLSVESDEMEFYRFLKKLFRDSVRE